jgi:hypothetical protein
MVAHILAKRNITDEMDVVLYKLLNDLNVFMASNDLYNVLLRVFVKRNVHLEVEQVVIVELGVVSLEDEMDTYIS